MFLLFITANFCYLIWLFFQVKKQIVISDGIKFSLLVVGVLLFLSLALILLIGNADFILNKIQRIIGVDFQKTITFINNLRNQFLSLHGGIDVTTLVINSLQIHILSPFTFISLIAILILTWSFLSLSIRDKSMIKKVDISISAREITRHIPILLLILSGAGLCLIPEFIYLRDIFSTRMNTIFKFYFQTWIIWGIASSAGLVIIWKNFNNPWKYIFRLAVIMIILSSLVYPFFAICAKTNNFHPINWTLDGNDYTAISNHDEIQAIEWLKNAPYGVIAEAVGGSYSSFARISSLTGLPTVLGWPGHEVQWRGGTNEMGSRESEIEMLYTTRDWLTAQSILSKYNIHYVYIGNLERMKYVIDENKFQQNLAKVFKNDNISIYRFK
jgi:uncharacterized membrane protein